MAASHAVKCVLFVPLLCIHVFITPMYILTTNFYLAIWADSLKKWSSHTGSSTYALTLLVHVHE